MARNTGNVHRSVAVLLWRQKRIELIGFLSVGAEQAVMSALLLSAQYVCNILHPREVIDDLHNTVHPMDLIVCDELPT